ncbi:MAG: SUMF1/EgtB/PvdO family nonheme iron enzyme, partial [Ignavibacteriae bacterium]|nr:SUMF1/EgtB/PvdO family nonheme iron enzyme [Ignavibacteriota bacterium]
MKQLLIKETTKFFLILACFAISSCDPSKETDSYDQPVRIGFQESIIELNVQGDQTRNIVAILGSYDDWSVTSSEPWVLLEKGTTNENGKLENTVVVSAEENTKYSRTATVTVKANYKGSSLTKSFEVVQETALEEPEISISSMVLNFLASNETQEVTVTTNQTEWLATTTSNWINLTQNGNTLVITTLENTESEMRTGEVLFEAGLEPFTARVTLTINQAKPDSKESITINGIELILVKAGTYYQGAQSTDPSAPNYYPGAAANQSPVHEVTITKDFYIGKYEVTQAQFESVMGYNPSATVGANHPVEMIYWTEANEYTTKLSLETGKQFRMPTEAEWEYAARGGIKSNGYIYSG